MTNAGVNLDSETVQGSYNAAYMNHLLVICLRDTGLHFVNSTTYVGQSNTTCELLCSKVQGYIKTFK